MTGPDVLESGRERAPHGRRAVGLVVLLLVLLAGGLVTGVLGTGHHAPRATAPAPAPARAVAARSPQPVAPAPELTPTDPASTEPASTEPLPPLAVSGDLGTTVSVGHVRSTAVDGDAHAALVEQALTAAPLGAHFVLAPQPGSTAAVPKGVEVLFDRRLDPGQVRVFVTAVEALPGDTGSVTQEAGTSVDLTVPVLPAGGCTPVGRGEAFSRWFPLFSLTAAPDHLVLSYTGPARSLEQLGANASLLARMCGLGIDDVRITPRAG